MTCNPCTNHDLYGTTYFVFTKSTFTSNTRYHSLQYFPLGIDVSPVTSPTRYRRRLPTSPQPVGFYNYRSCPTPPRTVSFTVHGTDPRTRVRGWVPCWSQRFYWCLGTGSEELPSLTLNSWPAPSRGTTLPSFTSRPRLVWGVESDAKEPRHVNVTRSRRVVRPNTSWLLPLLFGGLPRTLPDPSSLVGKLRSLLPVTLEENLPFSTNTPLLLSPEPPRTHERSPKPPAWRRTCQRGRDRLSRTCNDI